MFKWFVGAFVVLGAGAAAAWWWLNRPLIIRHPEFGTDCADLVADANLNQKVDCVRVWYGTNRELVFSNTNQNDEITDVIGGLGKSAGELHLGRADVWLPKLVDEGGSRALGETPHVKGAAPSESDKLAEFVFLTRITKSGRETFTSTLQDAIYQDAMDSILLFVHGFNVKFDDALVRAAQLSNDLSRNPEFSVGTPVLYSWPSAGALSLEDYRGDRERSLDAAPQLEAFLDILTEDIDVSRINIIAHSMGNRVLTQALEDYARDYLERHDRGDELEFRILLVAADVERDIFAAANGVFDNLDANVTIYTSDTDRALHISGLVNQAKRLGDTDTNKPYIRPTQNYQTIDATAVTTQLFGIGHNYYSDNPTILWDMMCTIGETDPQDRALEIARFGDLPDGDPYYRVNTTLAPRDDACKLRRTAYPTTEPVAEFAPSVRSMPPPVPMIEAPEPILEPQALPFMDFFYVEDYDDLDLTPYLPILERTLSGEAEIEAIAIRAFSDTVGTEAENLARTQRYADAVKAWFVSQGVDADLITATGLGESQLNMETEDEVAQPLNRFVEIEVQSAN